jgi:hypothetical protein
MQARIDELERQIDVENVSNYLRYRLIDTQDLVQNLKPYSDGKKLNSLLSKNDA